MNFRKHLLVSSPVQIPRAVLLHSPDGTEKYELLKLQKLDKFIANDGKAFVTTRSTDGDGIYDRVWESARILRTDLDIRPIDWRKDKLTPKQYKQHLRARTTRTVLWN
jgi:hypothetical protein